MHKTAKTLKTASLIFFHLSLPKATDETYRNMPKATDRTVNFRRGIIFWHFQFLSLTLSC